MKRISKLLLLVPALAALTLSAPAVSEVAKPQVPPAVKGEQCVEDTDDMRRNHMDYLQHHRDEALREGIRTKQHSLNECIECHVAPETEAQTASAEQGGHFCMNCHAYAGVRIDCFQCHATKPKQTALFHPLVTPGMKALKDVHQPDTGALLNQFASAHASKQTGGVQ